MTITFKLFSLLSKYLPASAERNQATIDIAENSSVADVLASHGVPLSACHLILINGHYTAPADAATKSLEDGDVLAVWPPVAGG